VISRKPESKAAGEEQHSWPILDIKDGNNGGQNFLTFG